MIDPNLPTTSRASMEQQDSEEMESGRTTQVDAENDELTGLCLTCDKGRFDLHQGDGGVQLLLANDFIHVLIRPFQIFQGIESHTPIGFIIKRSGYFVK